ncbi:MAG: isocitrate lyase/PEP mutase family protein [Alphaproteobacteria bacterium]|nr:isocitrate lyase/PEP mutase family protein [Alphaproteobacteria bacterium]
MSPAARLRALLAEPRCHAVPCCFDGLSARLLAEAGHRLSFMSGFAVSATRLGQPDTGLISMAEMADSVRNICAAAPSLALIADGDTGFGNAVNAQRAVATYARAGAAAIMIEDQVSPKKCGHTRGKAVIARDEAVARVRAAVEAAASHDILVMARTDARGTHGMDEALARMDAFAAAGADILFLEAPRDAAEMRRFVESAGGRPCMANLVHGGLTPVLPHAELERIGFRLAIYPLALLSAAVSAMRQAIAALAPGATTPLPATPSFPELQSIVGFPDYWATEERFKSTTP